MGDVQIDTKVVYTVQDPKDLAILQDRIALLPSDEKAKCSVDVGKTQIIVSEVRVIPV